jgi:rfaE bifunctional protein nucleotidyltransferase chain/domain
VSLQKPFLSWEEASSLARHCENKGGTVVTTNGTFDLIHKGHVSYLAGARGRGDLLLVAINSDASVKRYKGPDRPLNSEKDRAFVLSALRYVDGVCIFEEDTPAEWLRVIRPHLHVKGGDWDPAKIPEAAVLAEWGGRVVVEPYLSGVSTTNLIEKSRQTKG